MRGNWYEQQNWAGGGVTSLETTRFWLVGGLTVLSFPSKLREDDAKWNDSGVAWLQLLFSGDWNHKAPKVICQIIPKWCQLPLEMVAQMVDAIPKDFFQLETLWWTPPEKLDFHCRNLSAQGSTSTCLEGKSEIWCFWTSQLCFLKANVGYVWPWHVWPNPELQTW